MVLTVDIGNARIAIGGFQDGKIQFTSAVAADLRRTEDQYAIEFRDVLTLYGCQPRQFEGAILSSVVPALLPVLRRAVSKCLGTERVLVVSPGIRTGLNIKIDNAAILGSDLVCTAVAALAKYPMPCIIVDVGTATTFSALDRTGRYIGGAICPGAALSLDALSEKAAQLPHVGLDGEAELIGANTVACMRSGALFGTASMVDGMISRYREVLGETSAAVLTGELAPVILPYLRSRPVHDETLLMDGLFRLYQKNTGEKAL